MLIGARNAELRANDVGAPLSMAHGGEREAGEPSASEVRPGMMGECSVAQYASSPLLDW